MKMAFFSSQGDNLTLTTCEWLQKRKKKRTNTLLLCKINGLLTLLPRLLSSLFYKRTKHPRLFWDISLPSSKSAKFPNKVIFLCINTSSVKTYQHCEASRASLNLVTSNTTLCGSLFMPSYSRNKDTISNLSQILHLKINTGKNSI